MVFSDSVNNSGIVEQTRAIMGVDATQYPTYKIANSCNNYLNVLTGYALGKDRRFQWDDTNHTTLPEGKTDLILNQTDYSFLTDENGNRILTLLGVSILNSDTGLYEPLTEVDRNDPSVDLSTFGTQSGTPTSYDKIADNIIRLDYKPSALTAGLYFFFQRTPSLFNAADTTKEPGVALPLHRGFVINSAYDGALALGLSNLNVLAQERQIEDMRRDAYFAGRNQDTKRRMVPYIENTR